MNNDKNKLLGKLILGALILFVIAYHIMWPCFPYESYFCRGEYADSVAQPLGIASMVLGATFFLFLFLPSLVFRIWKKFAMIFLPLAFIWIALTNTVGGFLSPDKEGITFFLSAIYGVITGTIILVGGSVAFSRRIKEKSSSR